MLSRNQDRWFFERLNLIGGKNNSGKTCLLEAIACLSNKFDAGQIAQLKRSIIIRSF